MKKILKIILCIIVIILIIGYVSTIIMRNNVSFLGGSTVDVSEKYQGYKK